MATRRIQAAAINAVFVVIVFRQADDEPVVREDLAVLLGLIDDVEIVPSEARTAGAQTRFHHRASISHATHSDGSIGGRSQAQRQ